MKNLIALLAGGFLGLAILAAPVNIEFNDSIEDQIKVSKIEFNISVAEAKSKFRSSGFGKKSYSSGFGKKSKGFATKSKTKSNSWSPNSVPKWRKGDAAPAKKYKAGESPFAKAKEKRMQTGNQPFTAPSKNGTSTSIKSTGKAKAPAPKLSKTDRTKLYQKQAGSLNTKSAIDNRLKTQQTRARTQLHRSRSEIRQARADANYWRSQAQWERNRRWADRDMYGWGYGLHPGITYHDGWGNYGFGYTRSGLSVIDGMILASLFHRPQYHNEQVVVRQQPKVEEVMALPVGSKLTVDRSAIEVPDGNGGMDIFPIPEGSNIQVASMGTLIQTPDGYSVLLPSSKDEYRVTADYEVPEYAKQPQEYSEYNSGSGMSVWTWIGIVLLVVVVGGGVVYFIRK